jgi:hypothetical protein
VNIDEIEKREAVVTCLEDDAAALRDADGDNEISDNMEAAAALVRELERQNETLTDIISQCRSAAGWGTEADPMNIHGHAALMPEDVPGFIKDQFGRLERQVKEMEADARRYRWLRETGPRTLLQTAFDDKRAFQYHTDREAKEALDAAIDAALNKEQPNE